MSRANWKPRRAVLLCGLLYFPCLTIAAAADLQAALAGALKASAATAVVIDARSGRTLAQVGSGNTPAAPGSLLKPLFLAAALKRGYVLPDTAVFCRRDLRIIHAGRTWNLRCVHPSSPTAFAAREALAYSCNRYFAHLADRIPPGETESILRHYGLHSFAKTQSLPEQELLVLGLAGVLVTPRDMADAYRKLAPELNQGAAAQAVRAGLEDSVTYGMAHDAASPGVQILGKTGTAMDTNSSQSHGWFAGVSRIGQMQIITVIYLLGGNGGDAARLAHHFFAVASASP